jgi:hypothetical protein
LITNGLVPQCLDANMDADSIANLLYTQLFKNILVAFNEIASIEIVGYVND